MLLLFVMGVPRATAIGRHKGRAFFAILLTLSTATFVYGLIFSNPIDVGESGVRAINAFLANHSNPYSIQVDEVNINQIGHHFGGYKYFPLTLFLYGPGVALLGARGLYITNFIFFLGTIWSIYKLAEHLKESGQSSDTYTPVLIYASSVTILYENFIAGVNDGVIVFFALIAILAAFRKYENLSAILLGCAIGMKWVAGVLFLLALLPYVKNRVLYCLLAILVPFVTILPFFVWNPYDFISNTAIFFVYKQPDSTGFLTKFTMIWLRLTIQIGLFGLFWIIWVYYCKFLKLKRDVILILCTLITIFFLIPLESHRNHLLWLIPIIALGYAIDPARPTSK